MTSYANTISFPLHTPGRTTKASPADVRRNRDVIEAYIGKRRAAA